MLTIKNKDDLVVAMRQGVSIITPNNRLSNQLLHQFFVDNGSQTFDKVTCLPYQRFLQDIYKKIRHQHPTLLHPLLLSTHQQRYLWQQLLIEQQGECNEGLLNEVQDAWARCQHWQIDHNNPAFAQTPQTRQFQQWQQQLQRRLKKINAITTEQLAPYLLNYPDLLTSSGLIWVCFDDYTPQQRSLQEAMEVLGCQQYEYDLPSQSTTTYHYPANDSHDESLQMIQWLKEKLATNHARIAVVIPDLQKQCQQLQRLVQRHIPSHKFDISLGQPLIDYPLVAHALQWLQLDQQTINNHQALLVLHSPYLQGSQTEFNARAECMQNSKLLQETSLPMAAFINALGSTAPTLAGLLSNISAYPAEASPAAWISHFKARLVDLGFPGEYPLSSTSYQCFQRFMAVLDELLQLSIIKPLITQSEALRALHDVTKSTIFQAQKSTTPIQILGLLEASGCTFDCIWVAGLTDQCLPQKTNLSAFIPLDLQRDLQMPHASALRELQLAEQIVQRLQNGSPECVFSYPKLTGDIPNLPSPLIHHFPLLTLQQEPVLLTTPLLVSRNESYTLPLTTNEPISGGTALLANQAQCPFRAFATHRLNAKPALTVTDGPDASERGQVLHKILDVFWQKIGSQQGLLALTENELQQHIENAIVVALKPLLEDRNHSFTPLVQEVEVARLHHLIKASLEWEKQRPAFEIEALEQSFTLHLAGIDFRVRVDRLDKIKGTDKKWVIDYKSSLPLTKPWNDERPEAPQLLLYALLDDAINTLLFLQLKGGRIACSGLSEEDVSIPGINYLKKDERWSDRQQEWKQQLTDLATEFHTGHCPPAPTRSSTCQHCDFSNLCRIDRS